MPWSLDSIAQCGAFKLIQSFQFDPVNAKKLNKLFINLFSLFSRDEKIRTSDLYVPNVARYQLCYIPIINDTKVVKLFETAKRKMGTD